MNFARMPRWAAALFAVLVLVACAWNAHALAQRDAAHEADIAQRIDKGDRLDMDLYREIDRRVADGEGYYPAALAVHREFTFPTSPSVAVRTPVLAWTTALMGAQGWRTLAALLWGTNVLAWYAAFAGATHAERIGAGAAAAGFGAIAFMPNIYLSHEALAGLMLSLALALSQTRAWAGALALAAFATMLRELALPFLLAWGAVELLAGRRRKMLAIAAVLAVAIAAFAAHAHFVALNRLPGDNISPGWMGLIGPAQPLYGLHIMTLLQTLPLWLAGALGMLPLLGWAARGDLLSRLALLWCGGMAAGIALFARPENFYWAGLLVPAWGVGLAFVPRACGQLAAAISGRGASPRSASPV